MIQTVARHRLLAGAALVGAVAAGFGPLEAANYRMERVSVSAAGAVAISPSYQTIVSIGDEAPHGASSFCNNGFVNSLGFWSVRGGFNVPIQLHLGKGTDPGQIALQWTGAVDSFQLFRSESPVDVSQGDNLLATTSQCTANDSVPFGPPILFYTVTP